MPANAVSSVSRHSPRISGMARTVARLSRTVAAMERGALVRQFAHDMFGSGRSRIAIMPTSAQSRKPDVPISHGSAMSRCASCAAVKPPAIATPWPSIIARAKTRSGGR